MLDLKNSNDFSALIVSKPHKCLSSVAKDVPVADITSPAIQKILKDMQDAMNSQEDGVAIAAPQINQPLRIFCVSPKAYRKNSKDIDTVFINPKILKVSQEKEYMMEGCLSVRWLYGEVNRHKKCTIEFYNERGEKKQKGASGLLAQIFQHEIDHLNGILFDSKARKLENMPPEKQSTSGKS